MKVINYCSIFYCNCIYLLNNLILVYVFGLRLLVIYEDVNMCMIEMFLDFIEKLMMGCNNFFIYLFVYVFYVRIIDFEMLRFFFIENI